jgi:hypothetical protein
VTRKDYLLVAHRIAVTRSAYDDELEPQKIAAIDQVAMGLATDFAALSPSFDRQKFLRECGVN